MITRYCDKAPDIPPPSLYYTFRGVSEIRDSLRADADARLRPDYGVETKRGAAADAPPACGDKSPPRSREAPPPLPTDARPLPSDAAPAGATAFLCASEPLDEFGRSWTLVDNRAGPELHTKPSRCIAAPPRGRDADVPRAQVEENSILSYSSETGDAPTLLKARLEEMVDGATFSDEDDDADAEADDRGVGATAVTDGLLRFVARLSTADSWRRKLLERTHSDGRASSPGDLRRAASAGPRGTDRRVAATPRYRPSRSL